MDSRPPNSTLLVAFVKFDKFDHDFYTFFALILHDLALSALVQKPIKKGFSSRKTVFFMKEIVGQQHPKFMTSSKTKCVDPILMV